MVIVLLKLVKITRLVYNTLNVFSPYVASKVRHSKIIPISTRLHYQNHQAFFF